MIHKTITLKSEKQVAVVQAMEKAAWTVEGLNAGDEVEMTAYSFDGTVNKYGWVLPNGDLTIVWPSGKQANYTADETLGVLSDIPS